MTSEQFCYWLQGYVELQQEVPTEEQWRSIKEHLQTVFVKVTPQVPYPLGITPPPQPNPTTWIKPSEIPTDTIIC